MWKILYKVLLGDFGDFETVINNKKVINSNFFIWALFFICTLFLVVVMLNLLISFISESYGT